MISKIFLYLCAISVLLSCASTNVIGNQLYQATEPMLNKYSKFETCDLRYKYHSNESPSKLCTKVYERKCVERDYCKENQTCIDEVREYYNANLIGKKRDTAAEYCLCRTNAVKEKRNFKECSEIK